MKQIRPILIGLVTLAVGCLFATMLMGCSTVATGADPLVVRAEQTETIAYSTFDTFLKIDDANRAAIIAAAPAVHAFAEQLRQPVMDGTNQTRQGLLWVIQLDRVKLAYESGGGSSNAVTAAIASVESATSAAALDITIFGSITNK